MQEKGFIQKYGIYLAALVLALAAAGVMYYNHVNNQKIPVLKPMEDFTLEQLDGKPFHLSQTDGKVRLVSFIFTNCPDVCPATTAYMVQMQDELKQKGLYGTQVDFLSISFDPERDTPEVLQEYADRFRVDQSGWHILRGDEAAVEKVTKSFGIGVMKQPDGSYVHTMVTFLLDKQHNLRKMYGMGADMNTEEIMKDLELLADE
ncbi:MAG TPA: SCO family protein [Candidatus Bathyarchaeia archaeon]|nr:SCO family protein [Candidatus Bathyarchaeia archaeon]